MTLTLHVGAPKCGSSALQTALSLHPRLRRRDGSFVDYAAVNRKGIFTVGEAVRQKVGIFGYVSSPAAEHIARLDPRTLARYVKRHPVDLVMSAESWLAHPADWETILARTGLEVDVVVYVRPQVPVINSAWWQTGAWGGRPFSSWVRRRITSSIWTPLIEPWRTMRGVRSVSVRSASGDVVRDFLEEVLGVDYPFAEPLRTNTSLPADVLRLFQKYPELKPRKGRSRIDFILSAELGLKGPSLWVIDRATAAQIIEATRADNERLLGLMDAATAAAVRADPAWWDPDHFASRTVSPPEGEDPDPQAVERLAVGLAEALVRVRRREAAMLRRRAEDGDDED